MIVERFNANQVRPSSHVGLHPQMLTMDVIGNDGANVGFNKVQLRPPAARKHTDGMRATSEQYIRHASAFRSNSGPPI